MSNENTSFKITTPLTFGNFIIGSCIRLGLSSILVTFVVVIALVMLDISTTIIILVILGYILLIPTFSLIKLNKARRSNIKIIEYVFTPTEFTMEAPNNSKIQINKSVIKRVRIHNRFAMLQTTSGKQPILLTPGQALELKKFLDMNGYNT